MQRNHAIPIFQENVKSNIILCAEPLELELNEVLRAQQLSHPGYPPRSAPFGTDPTRQQVRLQGGREEATGSSPLPPFSLKTHT